MPTDQPQSESELNRIDVKEKPRTLKDVSQSNEDVTKEPPSKKAKTSTVKKQSSLNKNENVKKTASDEPVEADRVLSEKPRSNQKRRGWWKRLLDNQP
jgi:hypothetical protein